MPAVSPPQLVFRSANLRGGPSAFPDGNVRGIWPPTVGRSHPILYGSAGGVMGRLDIPTLYAKSPPARGLPAYCRYGAGVGGILVSPITGKWLVPTHLERAAPSSPKFFWGNIGLLQSGDYGQTTGPGTRFALSVRWREQFRAWTRRFAKELALPIC